jgi:murein DD-endopeptidase MepM/ murein hydrolase activator NlpD
VLQLGRKRLIHGMKKTILVCCLFLILTLVPAYASTTVSIENLRQQQQQIKQQHQNMVREGNHLTNVQEGAQTNFTSIQRNLQSTNSQIQDSESRLKVATERLQQLEVDLEVALDTYKKQQAATIARLRLLQRSPASRGLAVLLQSQNISDFISRRHQLKLVYQADQKILVKLATQANLMAEQKAQVEQQKNSIALIREELLAQKADDQAQAQLQSDLIQRLNSDRLALEVAQNQLDQDSQSVELLIQQKVKEEVHEKTKSKNVIIRGTGLLAYPSDAPTSSPFGWRIHPILGYRRFHAGLDFAASYGSTIRAADSGTVIFAGWYGGYGRAIIIDHGGDLTTLYGHTSAVYVSEGQKVERGQPIAAVGSTGLSTGPHLHFEVRRNGVPVNPADYL